MFHFEPITGHNISWTATGPAAGALLEEIRQAGNWRRSDRMSPATRVILHESPPPSGVTAQRIWPQFFGDQFQVAVAQDCRRYDFYLALRALNRQQRLFLRRIVSCLPLTGDIVAGNGILLHGALAEFQGRGVLFCGESGAGKSTAMRRLPDSWRKYCDDAIWVVRKDDGYYAHPLPTWSCDFYGVEPLPCDATQAIPIDMVCHLVHSTADRVTPLSRTQNRLGMTMAATALLYMLRAGLHATTGAMVMRKSLDFACDISGVLHGYRLDARIDGDFWRVVEREITSVKPTGVLAGKPPPLLDWKKINHPGFGRSRGGLGADQRSKAASN